MTPQRTTASVCMFIPGIHTVSLDHGSGHPEQRRGVQTDAVGNHMQTMSFRKLVQWIREEFEAAPDLRLSVSEAAGFLGLDVGTCERVLGELLRTGFLARGADGRYGALTVTT